jgi:hypothetical protein
MFFGGYRSQRTLNQQGLDICSGAADFGCFLLSSTLIVLWREPSPGTEMFRCGEHEHIHADFRNDRNSGRTLDTRHSHNKLNLGLKLGRTFIDQSLQRTFASIERAYVFEDKPQFFGLLKAGGGLDSQTEFRGGVF